MEHEKKGEEFIIQAEKRLKSFSFFSSGSKYEDAADLYKRAATSFKMAKRWQEAGDAFVQAAQNSTKAQNAHEAASFFVEAATCFRKVDPHRAIEHLRTAVQMHCEAGRFSAAAKLQKEIAELYESEMDIQNAIENYQIAADYYAGEEAHTSANQCLLKVAQFCAQLEQYDRAIEIFETVAAQSLDVPLLKYGVKDYLFKAGLCHLAKLASDLNNLQSVRNATQKYIDMDITFESSRECQFLRDIADSVEQMDVDKFTDVVFQYDNISKLDPWKTTLLVRLKKAIKDPQLT